MLNKTCITENCISCGKKDQKLAPNEGIINLSLKNKLPHCFEIFFTAYTKVFPESGFISVIVYLTAVLSVYFQEIQMYNC